MEHHLCWDRASLNMPCSVGTVRALGCIDRHCMGVDVSKVMNSDEHRVSRDAKVQAQVLGRFSVLENR